MGTLQRGTEKIIDFVRAIENRRLAAG
jgi:hypothetical protein